MKQLLPILFLVGAITATNAQVQFSLEDAIGYAMDNATAIKLDQKNIEDAESQLLEFKSIGIPKIEANLGYTYYPDLPTLYFPDFITPVTYSVLFEEGLVDPKPIPTTPPVPAQFGTDHNLDAGLSLNVLLFDYSWLTGLRAQELFRELVVKRLNVTEYQTRAFVTRAYLAVLISERTYELIADNISNIEKLWEETSAMYEAGFTEKLDVDRLDLSHNNLKIEQQKVLRQIEVSENLLKYQMGFPVSQDIELTDEFDILTEQLAVENIDLVAPIDYLSRPEYSALTLLEDLYEINVKALKASYGPVFKANAAYSQILGRNELFNSSDNPWFPSSYMGVSLSFPIFDGLERKAKIQRARISSEQATIDRVDFENAMDLEISNARIQYQNAKETVFARRDAMELAQNIFSTTQIKYREGVGSSVEVSQAESEVYTAQSNFINALYDLLVAKTDLDISLGKM